jgi:hypothetical protein
MSVWLINGNPPESYGLTVVRVDFNAARVSSVTLRASSKFDATEAFPYGSTITIAKDSVPFFRGKARRISKAGNSRSEGIDYAVEDVWADLERLTYQEPWAIRQTDYTGTAWLPTVILGMNSSGVRISVGEQILEALNFAVARGVSMTVGSIPAGMMLWPSKAVGMSCAAVIRECLKYYPDWVPWINHTTSPPTFSVTPRASATAVSVAVTDCESVEVSEIEDRVPEGVRICYITAGLIGDNVYRTLSVDQYPGVTDAELVAPAAAGVLVTSVELAGMQVQIQKQQIQTRDLPTTESGALAYLKIKFPAIKDIADAKMDITEWTTAVIASSDDESPPIDEKLVRIPGGSRSDLPRELVKGQVTEWMRKKVGRVLVQMKVEAVDATDAEKKKIKALPPSFTVIATNATTKTYRGISSFTAADDVPVGIAAAFYANILNAAKFEGQITIVGEEIYPTLFHGKKLNLTGCANGEWTTMDAPVHRVSYDIAAGRTTVYFGPNPELSFQDFLDYLRLLNKRPHNVYTQSERTGDEIGKENGISANGDTIGPYDGPETVTAGGGGDGGVEMPFELFSTGGNKLKIRESTVSGEVPDGFADGVKEFTVSTGSGVIYAKLTIDDTEGSVVSVTLEQASEMPVDAPPIYHEQIGSFTVTGSGAAAEISANNLRFGPIPVTICRNWFTAEAPFHGVTFL